MLPYVVLLMAVGYLVFHYTGLFEEVANFFGRFGQQGDRPRAKGEGTRDDQSARLQVFEDFFGTSGDKDEDPE